MKDLHTLYHNVCDTPQGHALNIDHMPAFFDYDSMDNSRPHVHSFYEIMWFQESGGIHTIDFQDYPIEAGTFFFLAPGQVHHFDGLTRHKGVLIQFCTDFLKDERAEEDLFLKYDVFNTFEKSPRVIVPPDGIISERLGQLVQLMEEETKLLQEFGHMDMLRSLVRQFLILVRRNGIREDKYPLDALRPNHRLFVRFRQLIEREFSRKHVVAEYAQMLAVSTKTLSNCVSECSDRTPLALINGRILLEARRLLRYSDLMVKEIAEQLGYDDPSYFVKFFKRQTGVLPLEFRESR